jgi:two-component system sensor histidine kinase BaeS
MTGTSSDSSVRRTQPETIIDDAITSAMRAYQAKGVALHAEAEASACTVEVDRERVAEVLANLLANALRHTPAGAAAGTAAQPRQRAPAL